MGLYLRSKVKGQLLVDTVAVGADLALGTSEDLEGGHFDVGGGEGLEEEVAVGSELGDDWRGTSIKAELRVDGEEAPSRHHVPEVLVVEGQVGAIQIDDGARAEPLRAPRPQRVVE